MKYWNTGDVVVDSILQKLEGIWNLALR